MSLDVTRERGIPLEKQSFTWRDLVRQPYSKLDTDAFTRVRVILMNGVESEQVRFLHAAARMNASLREPLARAGSRVNTRRRSRPRDPGPRRSGALGRAAMARVGDPD